MSQQQQQQQQRFLSLSRAARFFTTQDTKTGENTSKCHSITKWTQTIPNVRKIVQMTLKHATIFHSKSPSKIYPNWDFRFENIPSGNPVSFFMAKSSHTPF
jgi:hypothetical protein